ncbi:hypothetical protein M427DRAFT_71317, partial [Gonapodya prolifera JEL478]
MDLQVLQQQTPSREQTPPLPYNYSPGIGFEENFPDFQYSDYRPLTPPMPSSHRHATSFYASPNGDQAGDFNPFRGAQDELFPFPYNPIPPPPSAYVSPDPEWYSRATQHAWMDIPPPPPPPATDSGPSSFSDHDAVDLTHLPPLLSAVGREPSQPSVPPFGSPPSSSTVLRRSTPRIRIRPPATLPNGTSSALLPSPERDFGGTPDRETTPVIVLSSDDEEEDNGSSGGPIRRPRARMHRGPYIGSTPRLASAVGSGSATGGGSGSAAQASVEQSEELVDLTADDDGDVVDLDAEERDSNQGGDGTRERRGEDAEEDVEIVGYRGGWRSWDGLTTFAATIMNRLADRSRPLPSSASRPPVALVRRPA